MSTKPAKKGKGGRIGYKLTAEIIKKAAEMASNLYLEKDIYGSLGINRDTFYKWKKTSVEFKDALLKGKQKTSDRIIKDALERAKTDPYLMTFMLKNRMGYMEEQQKQNLRIKRAELQLKEEQFRLSKERFIAEIAEKASLNKDQILELLAKHGLNNAT